MARAFDAVLVIAFGGPQGRDDVRPFLANVLRGRRVPPERVEEVAHHYELFDGVSPLTELTTAAGGAAARSGCAIAGTSCRSMSGCATGIRSSRTRWRRWRAHGVRRAVGVHRRGAPELFELHAVSGKRRGRAGEPPQRAGSTMSRSCTSATGTRIRGSSRRTPITCATRWRACRRPCAIGRG